MILTEVTHDDLRSSLAFFKREYEALTAEPHRITLKNMKALTDQGTRWVTLEENGEITAAIGAAPFWTDKGRGYSIPCTMVAHDHPDKIRALDALCLFACNHLRSEGVKFVRSVVSGRTSVTYGSDYAGLKRGDPITLRDGELLGTPEDVIKAILARRPEWRTSFVTLTPIF